MSAARTSGAPKLIASAPAGSRQGPRSSNDALSRTLPRPLAQFDVERDGLAVALDLYGHDIAGRLALDAGRDVRRVVDAPSVDVGETRPVTTPRYGRSIVWPCLSRGTT